MSTEALEQSVPLTPNADSNPPEVRIECYMIHARKRNARKDATDAVVEFDDLLESDVAPLIDPDAESIARFKRFFEKFIQSFDGKFAVFKNGKAIGIKSDTVRFNSRDRTISGIVEGGQTSMGGFVKNQNGSTESEFILTPEHVSGQPYYFLLYLPAAAATGVMIFQSFSTSTYADVLKRTMMGFLAGQNGPVLSFETYLPDEVARSFRDNSNIQKISICRYSVSPDLATNIFNLDYAPETDFNIEMKITGNGAMKNIMDKIGDIWNHNSDNLRYFAINELSSLGFDDDSEIKFTFEKDGKSNTITSKNNFKFSPNFYVREGDIIRDSNYLPTFDSVDEYCRRYLGSIIDQIR